MSNEGRDEFEQRGQTDQPQQEQEPTEQQNTSPLSSDAETEPLTNDDPSLDGSLTQQEAMHVRASPAPAAEGSPTLHGAVVDDVHQGDTGETVTPSCNFGSESDLTDESERATPQPTETQDHGAHEDAPPLASSAESWDLTQKPGATGLKRSALDGLAELAASAGDMEQNDTAYTRTNDAGALETHASQDEVVEQEENTYARPVTYDGADADAIDKNVEADDDDNNNDNEDDDGHDDTAPRTPFTQVHDRIDDVAMDMHASPQRKTQSLHRAVIAAMGKRRAAATGGAPSLLVDQDVDSSNPPSAATSRQGSPTADSEDAVDATKAPEQEETASGKEDDNGADEDRSEEALGRMQEETGEEDTENMDVDERLEQRTSRKGQDQTKQEPGEDDSRADTVGEGDSERTEQRRKKATRTYEKEDAVMTTPSKGRGSTSAHSVDAAENEEETSLHRQEALDQLTRIELGFVMLRQRLYTERLEELEREADMIQQGTHPELRILHTLIDTRKEKRLACLDVWLRLQEQEYERLEKTEEKIAWVNWRDRAASIRREMMSQTDRKRRKLEREKRKLDEPQPARRNQPFEAEFAYKPPAYSRRTRQMPDLYMKSEASLRDVRNFVAYPDVRGLDEYDAWLDMEQMGIRPVPMPPPGYLRVDEVPPAAAHEPYVPAPLSSSSYATGGSEAAMPPGAEHMGYYGPLPPPPAGAHRGHFEHGPLPPPAGAYDGMYVDTMDMSRRAPQNAEYEAPIPARPSAAGGAAGVGAPGHASAADSGAGASASTGTGAPPFASSNMPTPTGNYSMSSEQTSLNGVPMTHVVRA